MNLRDEEQLQRYFDHTMSSAEEQNFLIDIAARDDMRLAFRSNLELLKALRADKDAATVSAAIVRGRTLTALGLGAALLPNALKEHEVAQSAAMPVASGSRLMSLVRRPAAMLLTGLLAGAALVYSLVPGGSTTQNHSSVPQVVTTPSTIVIPAPVPTDATPAATQNVSNGSAVQSAPHHTLSAKRALSVRETLPVTKTAKKGSIEVHSTVHSPENSSK